MWSLPPNLVEAFRHEYQVTPQVTAWRDGARLDVDMDVLSGSVTMTDSPGVRATLDLDVAPQPGLWDLLAPLGTTLRVSLEFRWGIERAVVPLGWFDVEQQSLSYDIGGVLSLSGCPDRWARVMIRRFDAPVTPNGNAVNLAVQYARTALGSDVGTAFISPSTARVRGQVYEESRDEAVQALLNAANKRAFVDRVGRLVVKARPELTGPAVWEVDSFHGGVLISADRGRSSRAVRNQIIVVPAGTAVFPRQYVSDTDPASPTRVTGPMGYRPRFYSSPSIRTAEQARIVGRSILRASTALGAEVTVTTAPHWGLEPGDLIDLALPGVGGDGWAAERHLIQSVTLPIPQRGKAATQTIVMRSTRPDGGDDIDGGAA